MIPQNRAVSQRSKDHFLLVLLAMALLNACLFRFLALPYHFVPSDDFGYYQALQLPDMDSIKALAQQHNPCYWLYLFCCSRLWSLFANASGNALIFSCLLANTLALVSIMLVSRRFTNSTGWAVAAGVLYLTSAWTNTYYYFFSYAPLPAALLVAGFSLIVKSTSLASQAENPAKRWSALAGAVLGVTFWVAPAAILPIALLLPLVLILPPSSKKRLSLFCWQTAGFGLTFIPFAILAWKAYLTHIVGNINTYHYEEAYAKFSYIPEAPAYSFIRVFGEYSATQAGLALLLTLLLGLAAIKQRRATNWQTAHQGPWLQAPFSVSLLLLAICCLHALAVDLLPTTKLGRTHFQIMPFVTLFLVITPCHLLATLPSRQAKKIIGACYGTALAISVVLAAQKSLETRAVRITVPEYLTKHSPSQPLYLLKEDPHAQYIAQWLSNKKSMPIATNAISQVIRDGIERGDKGILLIGPTGPQSGNSILEHSILPDFNLALPVSIAEKVIVLPYYSYYPPFLFEEEISQALYFAGKTPRYTTNDSSIKVLSW